MDHPTRRCLAVCLAVLLSLSTAGKGDSSEDVTLYSCAALSVLDEGYGTGGTAGNYTIEIHGSSFDRTVTAELADRGGAVCAASHHYYTDSVKLYATFDLTAVPPGTYDVVIRKPAADETVTIENGLRVVEGGGGTNKPFLINVPASIRRGSDTVYQFGVFWVNTGINDALAPVIELKCSEPFSDDPNELLQGWGCNNCVFYGAASGDGPRGILRPGKSGSKTFYIRPLPLLQDKREDVVFEVTRLYGELSAPFDWDLIKDYVNPLEMDPTACEDVIRSMMAGVGTRNGDFLAMLARNAALLPTTDEEGYSVHELVEIEFVRTAAAMGNSITGIINSGKTTASSGAIDVIARHVTTGDMHCTQSLEDGSFFLHCLPSGDYELEAVGYCHAAVRGSVAPDDCELVSIDLLPGYTLAGTVRDETSGQGIEGAFVSVCGECGTRFTRTNAKGCWHVTNCRGDDYSLCIEAPTYPHVARLIGSVSEDMVQLDEFLSRGRVLRGVMDTPGGGIHFEQCVVSAVKISAAGTDIEDVVLGEISADGVYEVAGLYPGTWEILCVEAGTVVSSSGHVSIASEDDVTANHIHHQNLSVDSSSGDPNLIWDTAGKMVMLSLYSEAHTVLKVFALGEVLGPFEPGAGAFELVMVNGYFEYWREYMMGRLTNPPLGGAMALTKIAADRGTIPLNPYHSWLPENTKLYRKIHNWITTYNYSDSSRSSPYADLYFRIVDAVKQDVLWKSPWPCGRGHSKTYTLEELGIDALRYSCYACRDAKFEVDSIFLGGVGLMGHQGQEIQETRALLAPSIVAVLDASSTEVQVRISFGVHVADSLDFWPDANLGSFWGTQVPLEVLAWYEEVGLAREQQHSSFHYVDWPVKTFKVERSSPCDGESDAWPDDSGGSDDDTGEPEGEMPGDDPGDVLPPGSDPNDLFPPGFDPGDWLPPDTDPGDDPDEDEAPDDPAGDEEEPEPQWECPEGYFFNPLTDTGMDPCITCQELKGQICLNFKDFLARISLYEGRELSMAEIAEAIELEKRFNDEIHVQAYLWYSGNCTEVLGQSFPGVIMSCLATRYLADWQVEF